MGGSVVLVPEMLPGLSYSGFVMLCIQVAYIPEAIFMQSGSPLEHAYHTAVTWLRLGDGASQCHFGSQVLNLMTLNDM